MTDDECCAIVFQGSQKFEDIEKCATATTGCSTMPITRDVISEIKRQLLDQPPEPIREWMLAKGFDPSRGCILVLPISMRDVVGSLLPNYVRLSEIVNSPTLIHGMGVV